MAVSSIILTLNEQVNLAGCLECVKWSDDIVVSDSFSADITVEIAKSAGARVVQREFDDYASQRNAALSEVEDKYPWVLMLDTDERVTPQLAEEIEATLSQATANITLYRVRRKDMFLGKWLRRSSGYPTMFGRLIRVGRVRIEREINEEYYTDDQVGYLKGHLIHYPFSKGLSYWLERHNRYSSMEASILTRELNRRVRFSSLFERDPVVRRKAIKQLGYRLPCRPLLVFCYPYVARLGFLDGRAGLIYTRLRSIYECMIVLKMKKIQRRKKGLPI